MLADYHREPEQSYLNNNPNIEPYFYDIEKELAARAFYNTSHHPERRGASLRASYAASLLEDKQRLAEAVKKAIAQGVEVILSHDVIIDNWFVGHRNTLKAKYLEYINAHSQVASAFITGPANFPTNRNKKRSATADNKSEAIEDYRKLSIKAMLKVLLPWGDGFNIYTNDPNAIEKLKVKLQGLENQREQMKKANVIVRKYYKNTMAISSQEKDRCEQELRDKTTFDLGTIVSLLVPNCMNKVIAFEPYQLSNLGAEIKRLNTRINDVEQVQSFKINDCFDNGINVSISDDQKILIHFGFKPEEVTRAILKKNAFKWSSKRESWVRKLTANAKASYEQNIKETLINL